MKARTGGDRIQNPSDPDATYDGRKGPGYQVQLAETCSPTNEVQPITAALPQTACETDVAAMVPMLDQLAGSDLFPEEMVADTPDCSDENVQTAAGRGVEPVGPIPGPDPQVGTRGPPGGLGPGRSRSGPALAAGSGAGAFSGFGCDACRRVRDRLRVGGLRDLRGSARHFAQILHAIASVCFRVGHP